MQRPYEDHVEIQEPPIEEMKKTRSRLGRGCVTGCVTILILLCIVGFTLQHFLIAKPKKLKQVPEWFPDIPLYDKDTISRVTYISGKQRKKSVEVALFIPRIILKPMAYVWEQYPLEDAPGGWKNVEFLYQKYVDDRDILIIEWQALSAEPRFLSEFFRTNLKKQDFSLEENTDTDNTAALRFSKDQVNGTLIIQDQKEKTGTDMMILIVAVPRT